MTQPRLSSVFDYSEHRLHPNGKRVSTNLIPQIAEAAVLTSRNRWIAKDAGGLAKIHKFQNIPETLQDPQRDEEFVRLRFEADNSHLEDKEEEEFETQGKKRRTKRSDGRKAKRQKFLQDYSFLRDDVSTPDNLTLDAGTKCFPYEPSSDLLKCIHRYASEYYTESGQLLNISRDYRKQKKIRRDKKKAESRTKINISPRSSQTCPNDDSLGSESDISPSGEDYGNERDSEADESKEKEKEKPQRKGRQKTAKQYQDMYKVFDGSAIMAIGMLVQEYIAEILDHQAPGEWEEEMRKAFSNERTSGDEEDTMDFDIDDLTGDDGSDSDSEIGSDEQDHDHGESSLRGKSEDSEDSDGDSLSTSLQSPGEVKIDPHSGWLGGPWEIPDRSLAERKVSRTLSPDLGLDEDDPIESSSDEIIRSSNAEDAKEIYGTPH